MTETEKLKDAIDAAGFTPRAYCGRGMYGEQCVGFDVESDEMIRAVFAVAENLNTDEVCIDGATFDTMGRDYIVYFPGVAWSE